MDSKKYYNLENSRDIQELMDLIENEDLSDIELGVGSVVPVSRPRPNILTRHLLKRAARDEENDLRDNFGSDEESGTDNENTINSVEEDDGDAIGGALRQGQSRRRNKKRNSKMEKTSFRKKNVEWIPISPDTSFTEPQYPIEYFLRYIPREEFEKMADCTNINALQ
ncbi:hypothetical protein JTB14_026785 [Gonioctena quinquepunctata]|nr:hypothetical protein JTB14_026785 [Gonioctena quinquepunctata]